MNVCAEAKHIQKLSHRPMQAKTLPLEWMYFCRDVIMRGWQLLFHCLFTEERERVCVCVCECVLCVCVCQANVRLLVGVKLWKGDNLLRIVYTYSVVVTLAQSPFFLFFCSGGLSFKRLTWDCTIFSLGHLTRLEMSQLYSRYTSGFGASMLRLCLQRFVI